MKYCPRCSFSHTRIDKIIKHLNRKTPCQANYCNFDTNYIKNNYDKCLHIFIKSFDIDNNDMNFDPSKFSCEHCYKKFNHKNNYYTHKKKYCKKIKSTHNLLTLKNELKEEIREELKEELEQNLQNQSFNNHGNHNSINSYNNSHNNSHNNIHIHINKYGEEKIDHISFDKWIQILNRKYLALQELIKTIHIDTKENRNVYISDIKSKYSKTYGGIKWDYNIQDDTLEELIIFNNGRIFDFITKNKNRINPIFFDKINKYHDQIENNRKKYYENIKLIFINNSDLIKEFYEENFEKKYNIII